MTSARKENLSNLSHSACLTSVMDLHTELQQELGETSNRLNIATDLRVTLS